MWHKHNPYLRRSGIAMNKQQKMIATQFPEELMQSLSADKDQQWTKYAEFLQLQGIRDKPTAVVKAPSLAMPLPLAPDIKIDFTKCCIPWTAPPDPFGKPWKVPVTSSVPRQANVCRVCLAHDDSKREDNSGEHSKARSVVTSTVTPEPVTFDSSSLTIETTPSTSKHHNDLDDNGTMTHSKFFIEVDDSIGTNNTTSPCLSEAAACERGADLLLGNDTGHRGATTVLTNDLVRSDLAEPTCAEILVDNGANGGILGDDVPIPEYKEHQSTVSVVNAENFEHSNLPLVTGAATMMTERGPVLAIIPRCALLEKGDTIHSCAPIEHMGHESDDSSDFDLVLDLDDLDLTRFDLDDLDLNQFDFGDLDLQDLDLKDLLDGISDCTQDLELQQLTRDLIPSIVSILEDAPCIAPILDTQSHDAKAPLKVFAFWSNMRIPTWQSEDQWDSQRWKPVKKAHDRNSTPPLFWLLCQLFVISLYNMKAGHPVDAYQQHGNTYGDIQPTVD